MNNLSGINEDGLDKLILNFYNYIEIIDKNFNNISDTIDKLESLYNSDCENELLKKMNNSKKIFKDANDKLIEYVEILSNIKLKYHDASVDISSNIKKSGISTVNDLNSKIEY